MLKRAPLRGEGGGKIRDFAAEIEREPGIAGFKDRKAPFLTRFIQPGGEKPLPLEPEPCQGFPVGGQQNFSQRGIKGAGVCCYQLSASSVTRLRRPITLEMGMEKHTPRASVLGPQVLLMAFITAFFSSLWATM